MIIRANNEFYTTTSHTEARMMMRNISEAEIVEVIENGDPQYTDDGDLIYIHEVNDRRIAVIIVEETEGGRIKTVYVVE